VDLTPAAPRGKHKGVPRKFKNAFGWAPAQHGYAGAGGVRALFGFVLFTAMLWTALAPERRDAVHLAYIGPGAGFAFLGSFLTLLAGFVLSAISLLSWPFRMAWRTIRRRKGFRHAKVRKVVFLGLDGLDPRLTERFMAEGKLPNFQRLREAGSYHHLRTTFPSLSPVAWSTFATGVSPARHNIFDFLNRDLKTYIPELSSARVRKPSRTLPVGKWRIPLSRPSVELRRKSQPFWKILGEHDIGSTILRVPITFPPDRFNGRQLSAMSTPDLRGTQGSFSFFSTRLEEAMYEGGSRYPLCRSGEFFGGTLEGPDNTLVDGGGPMRLPFRIHARNGGYTLEIDGQSAHLKPGEYSPWVHVAFRAGLGIRVHGIVRFLVTEIEPEFSLYASPIQIDPEKPALPISHPPFYAAYLAKILGSYSTLGMAEDTWALNEGVIDESGFLKQAYSLLEEREAMFRNALEKTRRGVVACVFDTSDRIQHMFYRHLPESSESGNGKGPSAHSEVIAGMYQRMDALAGLAMQHTDAKTALFILSDHGFCSFRRGINLNAWLRDNGYMVLKDGAAESGPHFRGVDWSRTRAYTMGLAGLYLNIRGREAQGIVAPADVQALKQELIAKLTDLQDPDLGTVGIRRVYATDSLYSGPYLSEAPDLIVGYSDGYRTSWGAAVGKVSATVFEDNSKAWSGDHCVDPLLVPGVLFSNLKLEYEDPGIEDLAPTTLSLFGLDPPRWMEGRPLGVHGV
jgi:predicted AlkP superfamily phosphohydrolase/phosphomutase